MTLAEIIAGTLAAPTISGQMLGDILRPQSQNMLATIMADQSRSLASLPGMADWLLGRPYRDTLWGDSKPASIGELWQRVMLRGLPDPVINSILRGPAYGEGEQIPTQAPNSQAGIAALRGEYDRNPAMDKRTEELWRELQMKIEHRENNYVFPENTNPWGSMWSSTKPYAAPADPNFSRAPLSLY